MSSKHAAHLLAKLPVLLLLTRSSSLAYRARSATVTGYTLSRTDLPLVALSVVVAVVLALNLVDFNAKLLLDIDLLLLTSFLFSSFCGSFGG